uniref:Uncharacterized protein n=1 Tax=Rhizophora mucronata TaxID=61149 RepID=A0A2P2PFG1_RHIMU
MLSFTCVETWVCCCPKLDKGGGLRKVGGLWQAVCLYITVKLH